MLQGAALAAGCACNPYLGDCVAHTSTNTRANTTLELYSARTTAITPANTSHGTCMSICISWPLIQVQIQPPVWFWAVVPRPLLPSSVPESPLSLYCPIPCVSIFFNCFISPSPFSAVRRMRPQNKDVCPHFEDSSRAAPFRPRQRSIDSLLGR